MKFIKCLLVLGLFAVNVSAMDYSVSDFGARGDGKTVNTRAIQRVIDLCAEKGGKVIIPQGEFVTGTLFLKSNVTLRLERGAHLLGSTNLFKSASCSSIITLPAGLLKFSSLVIGFLISLIIISPFINQFCTVQILILN